MKHILPISRAHKVRKGLFNIDIIFPGLALNNTVDPRGIAQLGRFDMGHLMPGTFVAMHMHKNDEILSYIRQGNLIHQDSAGTIEKISNTYLMMMNAGRGFYHQEEVPQGSEEVRMLQIFFRPEIEDEEPKVQFYNFKEPYSINSWRLIAGHTSYNPQLFIRSHAALYDLRLNNNFIALPNKMDKTYVVYLFSGEAQLSDETFLYEGDTFIYKNEDLTIATQDTADIVLFELDENQGYSTKGMFSGYNN